MKNEKHLSSMSSKECQVANSLKARFIFKSIRGFEAKEGQGLP